MCLWGGGGGAVLRSDTEGTAKLVKDAEVAVFAQLGRTGLEWEGV
jgi:hypothetical protein